MSPQDALCTRVESGCFQRSPAPTHKFADAACCFRRAHDEGQRAFAQLLPLLRRALCFITHQRAWFGTTLAQCMLIAGVCRRGRLDNQQLGQQVATRLCLAILTEFACFILKAAGDGRV